MKAGVSQVRWGLVLTAAVVIYVATFILGVALSFPLSALLNGSNPHSPGVSQATSVVSVLLLIAVTGYGALWVARRVERAAVMHGVLVGLVVAILSLALDALFRPITPVGLLLYALMVAAGWLGGVLGSRRRKQV